MRLTARQHKQKPNHVNNHFDAACLARKRCFPESQPPLHAYFWSPPFSGLVSNFTTTSRSVVGYMNLPIPHQRQVLPARDGSSFIQPVPRTTTPGRIPRLAIYLSSTESIYLFDLHAQNDSNGRRHKTNTERKPLPKHPEPLPPVSHSQRTLLLSSLL